VIIPSPSPDFVAATPEDIPEDLDDESTHKLKSAVWKGLDQFIEKTGQESEGVESLLVQHDNKTGDIVAQKIHTIHSPDGSTRTIKTVEKLKNGVGSVKVLKIEEMLQIQEGGENVRFSTELEGDKIQGDSWDEIFGEDEETETETEDQYRRRTGQDPVEAGPDDKKPNFADILAFLNPTEETLKQLVMEATTSQPKLLSQLLAADLPSLLRTFQQLLLQSHTLEGAYRALLTGVGEEGVEAYMDRALP